MQQPLVLNLIVQQQHQQQVCLGRKDGRLLQATTILERVP
jgi:hypothetical protein